MFLVKLKPNTNGQRWVQKYSKPFINTRLKLPLITVLCKSGRNVTGQITVRHRKSSKFNSYIRLNSSTFFSRYQIVQNFYSFGRLKNHVMSVEDVYGNITYIKSLSGILPGSLISVFYPIIDSDNEFYLGSVVFLKNLNIGHIFCNLNNFYKKKTIATSSGTYCSLAYLDLFLGLAKIILPSGLSKVISFEYSCLIGRVSHEKSSFSVLGKAGSSSSLGFRSSVRGVAMNPVDHPHGGRTKTNSPEKSPWGWVTKHSK